MRFVRLIALLSLALVFSGCATMMKPSGGGEVKSLKSENERLTAERNAYKSEAEKLAEDTKNIKTQLANLQSQLAQEKQKSAMLQSKIASLSDELESLQSMNVYNEKPEAPSSQDFTKKVQLALYAAGFDPGKIDGKMGPMTVQAIKDFQEANGLKVDGIVGKETWNILQKYLDMK